MHRTVATAQANRREPLRVAIGEFEQLISLGLWVVLSGDRGISVAGVDMAFDELVLLASEPHGPEVAVLDAARVQGRPLRRLQELAPEMGIVILVSPGESRSVSQMRAGATECLASDARPEEIVQAVRRVARASSAIGCQSLGSQGGGHDAAAIVPQLTKRQREVLALLIDGNTRATIALTLDIRESTVHAHMKTIFKRLGLDTRSAVREWAISGASPGRFT